jgi:hypothetical protein
MTGRAPPRQQVAREQLLQSRGTTMAAPSPPRLPAPRPPRKLRGTSERARSHGRRLEDVVAHHDREGRPRWLARRAPFNLNTGPQAAAAPATDDLPRGGCLAGSPRVQHPHQPARMDLGSLGRASSGRLPCTNDCHPAAARRDTGRRHHARSRARPRPRAFNPRHLWPMRHCAARSRASAPVDLGRHQNRCSTALVACEVLRNHFRGLEPWRWKR